MSLLHEGQRIRDTYEVECLLGEGAFGEVYLVRHDFFGRQAMKVFKLLALSRDETKAMLGEPILLSKINHRNIIQVFEANTVMTTNGERSFFTMEYVAGGTLDRFWRSHGEKFVPVETTVDIVRQICRGLEVAHSAKPPIIHRDIKPQNILIGIDAAGQRVRVSDFGLARRVNPLTLAATAAGTTMFKPPEVFSEEKADSAAADVWSVGVLRYLLLSDRFPYGAPEEGSMHNPQRFRRRLDPPSRFNCLSDPRLDEIAARALAVKSKERFQNATEVLTALRSWTPQTLSADPIPVSVTGLSEGSKTVLGPGEFSQNETEAQRLALRALRLARQAADLPAAADMMEQAFNKWPDLRARYAPKVKLWRCGIATPTHLAE